MFNDLTKILMAKKKSTKEAEVTTTAVQETIAHVTIEPIHGNKVKMIADQGFKLKSKHTGHTYQSVLTSHTAGWEVINDGVTKE